MNDKLIENNPHALKNGSFQNDLTMLINKHSLEQDSNTPDFILAEYLSYCLKSFDIINQKREEWYGRGPKSTDSPIVLCKSE